MLVHSVVAAALALAATANPIKEQQQILNDGFKEQQVDLIREFVLHYYPMHDLRGGRVNDLTYLHRLEKANIIPTILDPFGT